MTQAGLVACFAVCINCCFAAAGLAAAKKYGVRLTLCSGPGAAVIMAGTVVEMMVLLAHVSAVSPMLVVAFGAVVSGAACDAGCGFVFDAITLPCIGILAGIAVAAQAFPPFAWGVLACGGSLGALYLLTRGRGLGLGDAKLACCIGGATGAASGLESLGAAFVLGGAYAAYLLASKRAGRRDELRFAPYLAAGMAAVVLHGGFV